MNTSYRPRSPDAIERALSCLRLARRLLRKGGAKGAARRVASAIKSADGARLNAIMARAEVIDLTRAP